MSTPAETVDVEAIAARVREEFSRTLDDLKSLVRIPGVAWDSFDAEDLARSAEEVAALVRSTGIEDVQILTAEKEGGGTGSPAVVARRPAKAGKPTIMLYAHHDVQPPGDASLWNTPAFEPTQVGDRLYGRGAADDKAGIMVHIASLRAVLNVVEDFGVGVTFFFEGEEEAGSPSFRHFLEKYRDLLVADAIVVADSTNWKVGTPALTTSLRGVCAAEVEVRVLEHAVHSGMFGGPVLDAPTIAARLISTFHDDDGAVAIDGLVSHESAEVDYPEADFRQDASVVEGYRLAGKGALADRLWNKPALSIIGMDIPAVEVSSNTLLPVARFKVSIRLAPGQDTEQAANALTRHIEAQEVFGAHVTVDITESGQPFAADTTQPVTQACLWALQQAWDVAPVQIGVGGSIPFIADLRDVFADAQILVTGVEDPDSRAHSANESLHVGDFERAVTAEALLLAQMNIQGMSQGAAPVE
ncbi:dipeptidase [Zhihengliuella flava]|uniref:Acetylornithine deacetylase/succinyl-diaminopimelate desuccinylase-like protein n=1 Tax=Zhihengliuella flava TaxID=1285193 RepID=A0A931D7E0_9MICC|nr:dipeptidase [Zhihengliuella flava]MBG6083368.1 acetylornithine deacetylase/succinyl-diaminopimelate desuccinylase-like protein [Zhihengliuella flava]